MTIKVRVGLRGCSNLRLVGNAQQESGERISDVWRIGGRCRTAIKPEAGHCTVVGVSAKTNTQLRIRKITRHVAIIGTELKRVLSVRPRDAVENLLRIVDSM